MARKKQEFDPLAGPIGGSGLRKKKSKGKSFDVLGGGFGGDHPVEKDAFDSYADVSFGGSSDALMETGGGSSPRSKPGKKGLFASIFGGGGKKKQQKPQRESMPLEAEEERPESYVPKHVRDPELEIQDGVMETGIADRMVDPAYDEYGEPEYREQYEEPVPHHQSAGEPEDALFEEEEVASPPVRKPAERKTMPVSVPVRTVAPPPSSAGHRESQAASPAAAGPDMHVCHLCGAVSPTELPQFGSGSGEYVPLCRTCYRAVTTLIKFRDPEDEREIKTEWYTLCPNLDSDRADGVIAAARKNS